MNWDWEQEQWYVKDGSAGGDVINAKMKRWWRKGTGKKDKGLWKKVGRDCNYLRAK